MSGFERKIKHLILLNINLSQNYINYFKKCVTIVIYSTIIYLLATTILMIQKLKKKNLNIKRKILKKNICHLTLYTLKKDLK